MVYPNVKPSWWPSLVQCCSLSLCQGTGMGRLGCCVHLLQLWFYSHLSVITRNWPGLCELK